MIKTNENIFLKTKREILFKLFFGKPSVKRIVLPSFTSVIDSSPFLVWSKIQLPDFFSLKYSVLKINLNVQNSDKTANKSFKKRHKKFRKESIKALEFDSNFFFRMIDRGSVTEPTTEIEVVSLVR